MKDALIKKLNDKTAAIGIIGLGYVGLPLGLLYVQAGYKVIGFDIDIFLDVRQGCQVSHQYPLLLSTCASSARPQAAPSFLFPSGPICGGPAADAPWVRSRKNNRNAPVRRGSGNRIVAVKSV